MLLISDLDRVAPDEAETIRSNAKQFSLDAGIPYYLVLDELLKRIDRIICQKTGETFVEHNVSCRLYEEGRRRASTDD